MAEAGNVSDMDLPPPLLFMISVLLFASVESFSVSRMRISFLTELAPLGDSVIELPCSWFCGSVVLSSFFKHLIGLQVP